MAGDANKRVQTGDKLVIPARTWNGLVGMLQREGGR